MFNLGFSEILLLAVLALVLIGPKQLPDLARSVGRLLNEIKRAGGDMTSVLGDVEAKANEFVTFAEKRANKILSDAETQKTTEGEDKKLS